MSARVPSIYIDFHHTLWLGLSENMHVQSFKYHGHPVTRGMDCMHQKSFVEYTGHGDIPQLPGGAAIQLRPEFPFVRIHASRPSSGRVSQ